MMKDFSVSSRRKTKNVFSCRLTVLIEIDPKFLQIIFLDVIHRRNLGGGVGSTRN
jgi:hypothetical protein